MNSNRSRTRHSAESSTSRENLSNLYSSGDTETPNKDCQKQGVAEECPDLRVEAARGREREEEALGSFFFFLLFSFFLLFPCVLKGASRSDGETSCPRTTPLRHHRSRVSSSPAPRSRVAVNASPPSPPPSSTPPSRGLPTTGRTSTPEKEPPQPCMTRLRRPTAARAPSGVPAASPEVECSVPVGLRASRTPPPPCCHCHLFRPVATAAAMLTCLCRHHERIRRCLRR